MVVGINSTDRAHVNTGAMGALTTISSFGKFSDNTINTIKTNGLNSRYKFECSVSPVVSYFSEACTFDTSVAASGDCRSASNTLGGTLSSGGTNGGSNMALVSEGGTGGLSAYYGSPAGNPWNGCNVGGSGKLWVR